MSVLFFLIATVLVCIAVGSLVRVILREPISQEVAREQKNIEVARQRLEELRQRIAVGEIESADAETLQEEIERGLLIDLDETNGEEGFQIHSSRDKVNRWTAVAVALVIPIAAGALYLVLGQPSVISNPPVANTQVADGGVLDNETNLEAQAFEERTQEVMRRLMEQPDDALGWDTLARLFVAQERFAEAAGALKKFRELAGDSADVLVREANALAFANNGELRGEPESLIDRALELDPQHFGALFLAGFAVALRQDYQSALDYWHRAETLSPNEDVRSEIRRLISGAEAEIAGTGSSTGDGVSTVAAGQSVRVSVSVEPAILEQVDPQDSVFIFARALQGPAVPLAVVKRQVKDLPLVIELDDNSAMVPNMTISAFDKISIVARISRSGTAQAASGDFFGETEVIEPKITSEVAITISEQVL
jgi:cytochrome c-type biogenesis protein CcmH